jgi:hypothetical protein
MFVIAVTMPSHEANKNNDLCELKTTESCGTQNIVV